MKEITKLMTDKFKIMEIGIDFMGYRVTKENSLSFHHLVQPKRRGGKDEIENGAILVRNSSHDYLHIIERIDRKYFRFITEEMIKENKLGFIDMDIIRKIDEILLEFEDKHREDSFKKGNLILQDVYVRRLIREQS
jgi:hypothetical protein